MLRSVAEQAATELQEKIATLTGGEITSVNQVDRTLEWLAQHGCMLPNIQEKTLCEALNRPALSAPARQLIELRLDGAHAAVNKLTTMRAYVAADHRIRQAFRYHGAMPGRFTSLGVQLQNLKKPTVPDTAAAIGAVRTGVLAHVQARYAQPLSVVGDITRALIVPAPGHRLFIADLSGIESRGLAWLTNEQNKLARLRGLDPLDDHGGVAHRTADKTTLTGERRRRALAAPPIHRAPRGSRARRSYGGCAPCRSRRRR